MLVYDLFSHATIHNNHFLKTKASEKHNFFFKQLIYHVLEINIETMKLKKKEYNLSRTKNEIQDYNFHNYVRY